MKRRSADDAMYLIYATDKSSKIFEGGRAFVWSLRVMCSTEACCWLDDQI